MKTSVIIPCYNSSKHIKSVLECLFNQTIAFDEIIVVDDCSTDDTLLKIQNLPVVIIKHERNQGPAVARNSGANKATGDILTFIDSDAYASVDLNENVLMEFKKNKNDITFAGVGGQGIETEFHNIYDKWRYYHGAQNFGLKSKKSVPYLFGLCCSFRREIFDKVGGFDPFFRINAGEDFDLGLRLNKLGYRLAYNPKINVKHYHKDTEESLLRVHYNWSYWSLLSVIRSKKCKLKFILGPTWRLIRNSIVDIFKGRAELISLNLKVSKVKRNAIFQVFKDRKE